MLLRDVFARALIAAVATGSPPGTRPVEVIAYTGGIVDVGNGPEVFDLAGIELSAVPLLIDHDPARQAGYSITAEVISWRDPDGDPSAPELPALRLGGRLFVDDDEPEGRRVAKRSDQGNPQQASVRLEVHEEEQVPAGETRLINGRQLTGPFIHVKRSSLRETSFVSLGADKNTRAIAAQKKRESMADTDVTETEETPKTEGEDEAPIEAKAATIAELDAAFPDHPRFCMDQAKAGATLADAQAAFNKVIASEAKEAKAALAAATGKKGPRVPAVRPAGEAPVATQPQASPRDTLRAKVREACAKGEDRAAAVSRITREDPELYRQVLAQANPGKPAPTGR